MPANRLNRRSFVAVCTAFPGVRLLLAQQPPPAPQQPTFSADVKVVNVFATVRDKKGQIVKDLNKEDFTLLEDGRTQSIKYFTRQSDLPLTLGLLVDTSRSERRMIPTERSATYKFIEQVLRPDRDKAFLIHFDHEVELLQDLTASREKLEKSLELLAPSQEEADTDRPRDDNGGNRGGGNGGGGGGYPGGGGGGIGFPGGGGMGRHGGGGYPRGGGGGQRRAGGGTKLYDGIFLASDEIMSKQKGRKAVILLTDGEDNGSKSYLEEAVGSAQKADTVGYAIRITDEEIGSMVPRGWNGGGGGRGGGPERPDGKKVLKQIALETGGGYYEYGKKKPLDEIYAEIQDELRNQYSIGYTSDHSGDDKGYRKIALTVSQKGFVVQARQGYYA